MSGSESDVRTLSETSGFEDATPEVLEEPAKKNSNHRHSRRRANETTNITITPPASPPNERAESALNTASHRVKRVQGYVAIAVVVILIGVCLYGIFTNFGHEKCDCNDLRNYFCGILGACMMFLTGTVKEQFVK